MSSKEPRPLPYFSKNWRVSEHGIFNGTMRVARFDFDTCPSDMVKQSMYEELLALLVAPELQKRVDELEEERDTAISMLAEWCIRVDINGTGWDDWDESYKDAMHRPCAIRVLLDAAIAKERQKWKEEYGRE